jgi:hypothetical protein
MHGEANMPRKALLVLAAVVGAIAIPAGTAATVYSLLDYQSAVDSLQAIDPTIDPPPNDPNKDFAVGGFQGVDGNNVGFSAHSDPFGGNAQGKLSETKPFEGPYQGRFVVTCLAVAGTEAAMGLVPTDAASNDQHAEFILSVHDSRLPGGTDDKYAFESDVGVFAQDCAAYVTDALFGPFTIERGNILVNDALP